MLAVEVLTGPYWSKGDEDWDAIATRAVSAAIAATPHAPIAHGPATVEVAVKLSDDADVEALNSQWRGKPKPTNILSFPMVQPDLIPVMIGSDEGETLLGDMILAHGVCAQEAVDRGISLADHVTHLIIHGTLHLLGHDHQEDTEAEEMEALETSILASLGLHAPYAEIGDDA